MDLFLASSNLMLTAYLQNLITKVLELTPQLYFSHLPHHTVTPVIVVGALGISGGPGPVLGVNAAGARVNLPQQLGAAAPDVAHQVNLGTPEPYAPLYH